MDWSRKRIYNNFLQKWLDDNEILMWLSHNKGTSVVFIEALKGKIFKKMTADLTWLCE